MQPSRYAEGRKTQCDLKSTSCTRSTTSSNSSMRESGEDRDWRCLHLLSFVAQTKATTAPRNSSLTALEYTEDRFHDQSILWRPKASMCRLHQTQLVGVSGGPILAHSAPRRSQVSLSDFRLKVEIPAATRKLGLEKSGGT